MLKRTALSNAWVWRGVVSRTSALRAAMVSERSEDERATPSSAGPLGGRAQRCGERRPNPPRPASPVRVSFSTEEVGATASWQGARGARACTYSASWDWGAFEDVVSES